ncbi:MAG TPA: S1-like domain-containing RNA-binding protein [Candidatus Sulfotelmatobacter sp.]|nr:S1-like domain-containing RNA-binding protein [Candidatus Sulfotelmatobacter sp.]
MAIIGRRNRLSIERSSGPGFYLNGGELGEILLPGRYIPADVKPGDLLDVFVYLDSEDRLVATTEIPKVMVGEFACLKVVGVNPRVGAFLDWGLSKDLLLPFTEQEKPVRTGDMVAVYVYLDPVSRRIVASARLRRHLNQSGDTYQEKQQVNLLIVSETPLGYNAIVNNDRLGLLYHNTVGIPLNVGERMRGFVRVVRADGKIDLSLDQAGYSRVLPLKLRIVSALKDNGGKLDFDDDSPPLAIREKFQCSKNAFKLALAALYKSRRIEFTRPGIRLLDNTTFLPGR